MPAPALLEVTQLQRGFGSGSERLEVLKGIDMEITQGELVALMGPSGCGKSTLLNIIGGLLEGDSGKIRLGEMSFGIEKPAQLVQLRREGVGWIFQDFYLLAHLTALDNVALALELAGLEASDAEQQAKEALIRVGLEDRMDHIPDQLSGGQQQRVAIARAIAGNRKMLLADEPTGNLDSKTGVEILDLLDKLHADGKTIIMVTHDEEVAERADRVIRLMDGLVDRDELNHR